MELKIGDIVVLSKDSKYWKQSFGRSNPRGVEGMITSIDPTPLIAIDPLNIQVVWMHPDGVKITNSYSAGDLELIRVEYGGYNIY